MSHTVITQRENGSRRVALELPTESHVEQTHVGSTNINAIVRKYRKTGELPPPRDGGEVYGDFAFAEDYHTAQNRLKEAEEQFMEMPSDLRTHFQNDPGLFFEFVNNPDNLEECRELGLLPKAEKTPPEGPTTEKLPLETIQPLPAAPSPAPAPAPLPGPVPG